MKISRIAFLSLLLPLTHYYAACTVLVQGNGDIPKTFTTNITTKAFDPAHGRIYVGLNIDTETPTAAHALSKVERYFGISDPRAIGITSNELVSSKAIEFLSLSTVPGVPAPKLACVITETSLPREDLDAAREMTVFVVSTDGDIVQQSPTLLDASGAMSFDGAETNGVVNIAANNDFIFAAVRPNEGTFGEDDSGIAVVRINQPSLELFQTAAQGGDMGIKAKKVDPSVSPQIKGDALLGDPVFVKDRIALHWDDHLQRLFIGLQLRTGTTEENNVAKAVVVAQIENGTLILHEFLPTSALTTLGQDDAIVAAIQMDDTPLDLAINHIRVMHTSTGASYLIVNGGNGTISPDESDMATGTVGNRIFALPLVDIEDPDDSTQGKLADKDMFNIENKRFETPATVNANLTTTSDSFATVGMCYLPLEPSNVISDIVIGDDTVYVSINVPQNDLNDTGIFSSQAIFDEEGKIARWTPWSKRTFPFEGIPATMMQGRISLFDVDAATGAIWAIGGDNQQVLALTRWDHGFLDAITGSQSLAHRLNQELTTGCYSALDLDQSTRGLGVSSPSRYALFGGVGRVAFARTSISRAAMTDFSKTGDYVQSQTVVTDYQLEENFLITHLPPSAGCCTHLEYSRQEADATTNYFFSGTPTGLFVFASATGSGFNVATADELNTTPFDGRWYGVSEIKGRIIDIKTTGTMLYVLVNEPDDTPYTSVLYRIPFTTSITTMFDETNIIEIARSATGPTLFSTVFFTGIALIAANTTGSEEQLVLASNNGLFQSTRNNGVQDATNQTDASWEIIASTEATFWSLISSMDNAALPSSRPGTVWPLPILDEDQQKIFEKSGLTQLSGVDTTLMFCPVPFSSTNSSLQFFPFIKYFFTDGTRRFLITQDNETLSPPTKLLLSPFNATRWNIKQLAQYAIFDPGITIKETLFWIRQIGATGILMAGTSRGVVALE